jgi:uncharacterized protein
VPTVGSCSYPRCVDITVRAYAGLGDLLDSRELTVPFGTPRSVKDLVESIGIPHVELDLVVVDGTSVGFDHLLTGGERVAVYPPFHDLAPIGDGRRLWPAPPEPRRFVLDVHLGTLARRLRLLGFDCWYRTDADDALLATIAEADDRILLSRDRQLLMRRTIVHGYLPRSGDPDRQLTEVVRRYDLDLRARPLTRCVPCNGRLEPVTKDEVNHLLPPGTRRNFDTFARCRDCGQVFWSGAHADAISSILDRADLTRADRPGPGGTAAPA